MVNYLKIYAQDQIVLNLYQRLPINTIYLCASILVLSAEISIIAKIIIFNRATETSKEA